MKRLMLAIPVLLAGLMTAGCSLHRLVSNTTVTLRAQGTCGPAGIGAGPEAATIGYRGDGSVPRVHTTGGLVGAGKIRAMATGITTAIGATDYP